MRTFENLLFGSRHERSFQSDSQRVADESTQLADLTQISGLSPIGKMSILERNHLFSVMAPRFEVKWHFRDHDQAICLLIVPCGHYRHRIPPPTDHDNHSQNCAFRLIFLHPTSRDVFHLSRACFLCCGLLSRWFYHATGRQSKPTEVDVILSLLLRPPSSGWYAGRLSRICGGSPIKDRFDLAHVRIR